MTPACVGKAALLCLFSVVAALGQTLHFAAIGDSGTGEEGQLQVARQMENFYRTHSWQFVLMLGDNIYPDGDPREFDWKFRRVYRKLTAAGVKFHATLGGHDRISPLGRRGMAEVEDDAFGFIGHQDEYVLTAGPKVDGKVLARFICLNSEAWLEELRNRKRLEPRLARLRSRLQHSGDFHWNFVFMHSPLYSFTFSSYFGRLLGRYGHGSEIELQTVLEPEFQGKVDAVLSGHEHFYQKIRPQKGIHYFVSGGGSKVRLGVNRRHPQVEFAAEALHFMDFELTPAELKYAAISAKGTVIHAGAITKSSERH